MTHEWFDLLVQRVQIGVEFVDALHPLLILLMAWFLRAQTEPLYGPRRYATGASHFSCIVFFLYIGFRYATDDMSEAWAVAVSFGRGVLIFQIVLALLTLFHAEITSPLFALSFLQTLFFRRLPRFVRDLASRFTPPPPLEPPPPRPPKPSPTTLRQQNLDHLRETYRHNLTLIENTDLPRREQRAAREQARRNYLKHLRRLIDESPSK